MKLELANNMLISPADNIVMNLLFIVIPKSSTRKEIKKTSRLENHVDNHISF